MLQTTRLGKVLPMNASVIPGAYRVLLFLRAAREPQSLDTVQRCLGISSIHKTVKWLADRECLEKTDSNRWQITHTGVMEIYRLAERFESTEQNPGRPAVAPSV